MTTYIGTNYTAPGDTPVLAEWQAWQAAVKAALTGCGLVQTSDTGQTDPATAVVPGVNVDTQWLIYRFNDSLQGSSPIFLKVILSRHTGVAGARIKLQVGQGSNGAGTLTGTLLGAPATCGLGPNTSFSAYTTYDMATHSEGHAALIDRYAGSSHYYTMGSLFSITRTRDSSGAFDGKGLFLLSGYPASTTGVSGTNMLTLRLASPITVYGAEGNTSFCIVPGQPANTALLNGDKQLYPHFGNFPEVIQSWATFTVRMSEFGVLPTTFTASPFAGVARTFISTGVQGAGLRSANANFDGSWGPCILWE